MNNLNGELLDTWINLITSINSNRLTSKMPLNDSIILRLLYQAKDKPITATYLCQKLGMQKSQMNRILENMEKQNLITRERSIDDKRNIIIKLNTKQMELFTQQHQEIIQYIDNIINKLGTTKTKQTIELLNEIISITKGDQK